MNMIKNLDNARQVLWSTLYGHYTDENIKASHLETAMHIIEDTVAALEELQADASTGAGVLAEIAAKTEGETNLIELRTLDEFRAMEEEELANILVGFLEVL